MPTITLSTVNEKLASMDSKFANEFPRSILEDATERRRKFGRELRIMKSRSIKSKYARGKVHKVSGNNERPEDVPSYEISALYNPRKQPMKKIMKQEYFEGYLENKEEFFPWGVPLQEWMLPEALEQLEGFTSDEEEEDEDEEASFQQALYESVRVQSLADSPMVLEPSLPAFCNEFPPLCIPSTLLGESSLRSAYGLFQRFGFKFCLGQAIPTSCTSFGIISDVDARNRTNVFENEFVCLVNPLNIEPTALIDYRFFEMCALKHYSFPVGVSVEHVLTPLALSSAERFWNEFGERLEKERAMLQPSSSSSQCGGGLPLHLDFSFLGNCDDDVREERGNTLMDVSSSSSSSSSQGAKKGRPAQLIVHEDPRSMKRRGRGLFSLEHLHEPLTP
jgi:hypothetical protein